eukprot:c20528_g1_i3 orf=124-627(-)
MGSYTVQEILVYPVKSCKGVSVPEACLSITGFRYDREWMVVSASNGRSIAQDSAPKLAVVQPFLPLRLFGGERPSEADMIEISAPGMSSLRVPVKPSDHVGKVAQGERGSLIDVEVGSWTGKAVDEGSQAANWWSCFLGRSARFVRINHDNGNISFRGNPWIEEEPC